MPFLFALIYIWLLWSLSLAFYFPLISILIYLLLSKKNVLRFHNSFASYSKTLFFSFASSIFLFFYQSPSQTFFHFLLLSLDSLPFHSQSILSFHSFSFRLYYFLFFAFRSLFIFWFILGLVFSLYFLYAWVSSSRPATTFFLFNHFNLEMDSVIQNIPLFICRRKHLAGFQFIFLLFTVVHPSTNIEISRNIANDLSIG